MNIFATYVDRVKPNAITTRCDNCASRGDLVLVELPPNCRVDASTSEIHEALGNVVRTLAESGVISYDVVRWACGALEDVRTLLGAPRET